MRNRDIEKRLDALEAKSGVNVTGIWWSDEPDLVRVNETEERLTVAEWEAKYPEGMLIRVNYVEVDELGTPEAVTA